jgi:hypothetical protein
MVLKDDHFAVTEVRLRGEGRVYKACGRAGRDDVEASAATGDYAAGSGHAIEAT